MRTRRYTFLLTLAILACCSDSIYAQGGLAGKDFWLAFPQNARFERFAGSRYRIFVTGIAGTMGMIDEFATGKHSPFVIRSSGVSELEIDTTAELVTQGVHKAAVHVTTEAPVTIVAVSYRPASMDSYTAIPTALVGTDYAAIGYDSIPGLDHYHSQCDIIATENGTTITMNYPVRLHDGRLIQTATIDRGEVLHIGGDQAPPDITGTLIHANKPVAVVTGHACAQVPSNVYYCDLLMEMIPPQNKLGRTFAAGTFKWQVASSLRVVAVEDNTVVTLAGKRVAILQRGEFYQNDAIREACLIEVSKPAYAMQYMHSSDEAQNSFAAADPSMVILVPVERMLSSVTSVIPDIHPRGGTVAPNAQGEAWQDWLTIVTRKDDLAKLHLNGRTIEETSVVPIGSGEFVAATVQVHSGKVELGGAPFAAYSYGVGLHENAFESYAHTLGMDLQ